MRLGILGGSFDPVHLGHLLLAECCREAAQLDQVWLVPAAVPPHKQQQVLTASRHRLEMLQLAVAGHEALQVSPLELDRGGVSYTVDTLQAVHAMQPAAELFLLLGADALHDLPNWRDPARICQLALPVVVRRAGQPPPDLSILNGIVDPPRIAAIDQHQVRMPQIELSSSDLRERVRQGQSIRYRTPRAVEKYIQTHGLYRDQER